MTTAVQVQYRRGTAAQVASFTGAQGELIVDTTDNRIVVQDGSTAGGWPAAKLAEVITNTRTAVTDANYTAQTADRLIAYTAITATRTVTLPAASSFPTGTRLSIVDESGACSPANSITVSRSGSDTIDGGTSASITLAYGYLAVQSNGAGKWTIVDQATTNLPAVSIGTAYDPNNVLSVAGASALFSGSGNFNVTVNKGGSAGAASDTASFIFEDGFVGYGQIGLCGDDNFHFKVSPNGSTWYDSFDIANSSGLVNINHGVSVLGGDVMVGNNTPTAPVTITAQTATLPGPSSGTQIHLVGSNAANAFIQWNTYAGSGRFLFERAGGTLGGESALANGDAIGQITYRGYNGSGYTSGNSAAMVVTTVGAWTSSNTGSVFQFLTTAQNATSDATAMSIYAGVVIGGGTTDPGAGNLAVGGAQQIGSPTGGILGAGTLNVATGIYLNNTAYTNPDFVFEKHFTGAVKKYADRPRAGSYRGLMQLDALAAHVRENLRLPGISDEPADIFQRSDIALEKIEEHTLYILQLHRRVLALEARSH
jgi:hypothetical protein